MARQRLRGALSAALPRGPLDLAWQCLLVAGVYCSWRYARGAVDGTEAESVSHAWEVVSIEQGLRSLIEPGVQSWAQSTGWAIDFANWAYSHAHFKVSLLALVVVYFAYNRSFCFVRNMLFCAMALSLIGYALYPTAPPRFLPGLGVEDSVAAFTGDGSIQSSGDPWFNAYAAVPSMHVGFALILCWSLALLVRPRALRAACFAYPFVITYVVIATGNHYWVDAFLGALAALASLLVATVLARLRPERWSFLPRQPAEAEPAVRPAPEVAAA